MKPWTLKLKDRWQAIKRNARIILLHDPLPTDPKALETLRSGLIGIYYFSKRVESDQIKNGILHHADRMQGAIDHLMGKT